MVMGITDRNSKACSEIHKSLKEKGYRVEIDLRNEKIGFKIREHTLQRIPYLLIVGDQEEKDNKISIRNRSGEDLGKMSLESFVLTLQKDISKKGR